MVQYVQNFITEDEESSLLEFFNGKEWDLTLQRRTQHYGWKYPYKTRDKLEKTNEIPKEIDWLLERLKEKYDITFDQLIVNEYTPGQGISPHIDNSNLFGDTIISLSLGSQCVMKFDSEEDHFQKVLERRSVVCLQGDYRYRYLHSIPARKKDDGVQRNTRISLTFRTVQN